MNPETPFGRALYHEMCEEEKAHRPNDLLPHVLREWVTRESIERGLRITERWWEGITDERFIKWPELLQRALTRMHETEAGDMPETT